MENSVQDLNLHILIRGHIWTHQPIVNAIAIFFAKYTYAISGCGKFHQTC